MAKVRHKKGQSILEYVLVITAIIGIILFAASQFIQTGVNKTLTSADSAISNVAGHF